MSETGTSKRDDEQAIRNLVDEWLEASKKSDLDKILSLMSDDVVFMVPGAEPFGREAFTARTSQMKEMKLNAKHDIKEIKVLGDWAWMRNYLEISITPANGETMHKAGYVLTILQKKADGRWVIARDANLLIDKK
jgi:uncharacterized protein (TIGR02246 family)